ncbi:hypothetical protein RND81_07G023800 [Saponaria officinalis]|uniref:FAR1 domain-containing protein n=1 Tax=Saponaria officinalis TaxID=3572 RepID=A0AAW1JPT1_SAPOF
MEELQSLHTRIEEPSIIKPNVIGEGGEEKIIVVEAETSELLGKTAENEQKAYEIYNDYAFLMGFSIRQSKQRNISNQTAGYKTSTGKHYSKLNNRTNCLAKITCYIDEQGVYTIRKYHMEHNHQLCPEDKRHLLRSQRNTDENGRLCNIFWRDGQMKKDYNLFGDSVVHATTYITNRYDMICAPFSFILLFKTFLKSMDEKQPATLMTDQSAAIAAAIRVVFNKSHHRLALKGFVEIFDLVLKYVDTTAEFYFYWDRLINEYKCGDNVWLKKLYYCKEKWCPAFSKEHFSGGILSSQRSETTNDSFSRRHCVTAGLCDFYSIFVDVVSEWRNKKINDDFRCLQGSQEMISNHVNILTHARDVYTIEIYHLFEEQFLKSMTLYQRLHDKSEDLFIYHVGDASKYQTSDLIKHVVTFNQKENSICCTCQMYSQVGILRCHCLRIMNIHCVYLKTKQLVDEELGCSRVSENSSLVHKEVGSSSTIKNPAKSIMPGQRNTRRQSTVEKIHNIVRGHKAKSFRAANHTKKTAQTAVKKTVKTIVGEGYLVHPPNGGHLLLPAVSNGQYSMVPPANNPYQTFVHPNCSLGQQFNIFTQHPTMSSSQSYIFPQDQHFNSSNEAS